MKVTEYIEIATELMWHEAIGRLPVAVAKIAQVDELKGFLYWHPVPIPGTSVHFLAPCRRGCEYIPSLAVSAKIRRLAEQYVEPQGPSDEGGTR